MKVKSFLFSYIIDTSHTRLRRDYVQNLNSLFGNKQPGNLELLSSEESQEYLSSLEDGNVLLDKLLILSKPTGDDCVPFSFFKPLHHVFSNYEIFGRAKGFFFETLKVDHLSLTIIVGFFGIIGSVLSQSCLSCGREIKRSNLDDVIRCQQARSQAKLQGRASTKTYIKQSYQKEWSLVAGIHS